MNKQEALEAILEECRKYEAPDGMVSEPARQKLREALMESVDGANMAGEEEPELRTGYLVQAGGVLLAMLVDEQG